MLMRDDPQLPAFARSQMGMQPYCIVLSRDPDVCLFLSDWFQAPQCPVLWRFNRELERGRWAPRRVCCVRFARTQTCCCDGSPPTTSASSSTACPSSPRRSAAPFFADDSLPASTGRTLLLVTQRATSKLSMVLCYPGKDLSQVLADQ